MGKKGSVILTFIRDALMSRRYTNLAWVHKEDYPNLPWINDDGQFFKLVTEGLHRREIKSSTDYNAPARDWHLLRNRGTVAEETKMKGKFIQALEGSKFLEKFKDPDNKNVRIFKIIKRHYKIAKKSDKAFNKSPLPSPESGYETESGCSESGMLVNSPARSKDCLAVALMESGLDLNYSTDAYNLNSASVANEPKFSELNVGASALDVEMEEFSTINQTDLTELSCVETDKELQPKAEGNTLLGDSDVPDGIVDLVLDYDLGELGSVCWDPGDFGIHQRDITLDEEDLKVLKNLDDYLNFYSMQSFCEVTCHDAISEGIQLACEPCSPVVNADYESIQTYVAHEVLTANTLSDFNMNTKVITDGKGYILFTVGDRTYAIVYRKIADKGTMLHCFGMIPYSLDGTCCSRVTIGIEEYSIAFKMRSFGHYQSLRMSDIHTKALIPNIDGLNKSI